MRYPIDALALTVIAGLLALSVLPLLITLSWWLLAPYWLILLFLKNAALAAQHNHAHLSVFRSPFLNFCYDTVLTQLTGYSTPEWELQHARGHHRHYLNPRRDLTSPVDAAGQMLPIWPYTWQGTRGSFGEARAIARADRQRGKARSSYRLWGHLSLQLTITLLWILWNPLMGGLFFGLSNLICRAMLWWGTYWQHVNAPCTSLYDASNTVTHPWLNRLIFNNGYHTAHHEQPGLHWSLLPARTAAIRSQIPDRCYRNDVNFHLLPPPEKAG
ncbi:MAG: fatty acid desaturase [Candidatus Sericytochromatia bacterium]|nr:fatty acid desaturase [Candidatus Sericytochromatia bacterium]